MALRKNPADCPANLPEGIEIYEIDNSHGSVDTKAESPRSHFAIRARLKGDFVCRELSSARMRQPFEADGVVVKLVFPIQARHFPERSFDEAQSIAE